ncbi:NACHT domain-containing protein [Sediminispirochaeta bajacaliforniensis]|uniref:hypothetical protein n=1 Tax=Sediminispirochaeta bajacaliforniensis TaxID=148 RepID=UPI0003AAE720|nr:hypothetical protein [Sediminispirochaeta bajacaliforniensis]
MDIERTIESIEIEYDTDSNFDDLYIRSGSKSFYCPMKDFDSIELSDLAINPNSINIKNRTHKLSNDVNIIFFKSINIVPNTEILGIEAYLLEKVYLISLSREESLVKIENFYSQDIKRDLRIQQFFENCMDQRKRVINNHDLPIIDIFDKELYEPTVNVGEIPSLDSNELLIIGKPGIGKSHLVNVIKEQFSHVLLYRFWISNQDKDYENRLKYHCFIYDLGKELFNDQIQRNEDEIIEEINRQNRIVIIDGLDHVENYNSDDLEKFIRFFNKLKKKNKIIILSRPLKINLDYYSISMTTWSEDQSYKVLSELYHISDYSIMRRIHTISKGYPLILRYISSHFLKTKEIPELGSLDDLDDYYSEIIKRLDSKNVLTIFLTNHSFFMKSELIEILQEEFAQILLDIVDVHPYLFDINLNRISLFHDSFISFLRKDNNFLESKQIQVNEYVKASILSKDVKFLSRFAFFKFNLEDIKEILKKYCSLQVLKELLTLTFDFESIRDFYRQLRDALLLINAKDLEIIEYYNLSIIENIIERDHLSSIFSFYYIFVKAILAEGFSEKNITSSGYLFGMFLYLRKNDPQFLYKVTNDNHFSTDRFYDELDNAVQEEDQFFYFYKEREFVCTEEEYLELVKDKKEYELHEILTHFLTRIYFFDVDGYHLNKLKEIINLYVSGNEIEAEYQLYSLFRNINFTQFWMKRILSDAREKIAALGAIFPNNEYVYMDLKSIIFDYNHLGSFFLWPKIQNKLRLDLYNEEATCITDIGLFLPMYFNRKDYTVIEISTALTVFEKYDFLDSKKSCSIIKHIQRMSEKGIRTIFNDYIIEHDPSILLMIDQNFNIEELQIYWFDLPKEYINVFTDKIFNYAFYNLRRYNSHSKEINISDIENLIDSTRWNEAKEILEYLKFSIVIPSGNKFYLETLHYDMSLIKETHSEKKEEDTNEGDFTRKGYISKDDIETLKDRGLSPAEVASYPDGWHSMLSDLSIYDFYENDMVNRDMKEIIYNAITGNIRSISMFGNLYHLLGNVPALLEKYCSGEGIQLLYSSFIDFLEISFLNDFGTRKQ